jgi:putrescine transport system substrate-binding protein
MKVRPYIRKFHSSQYINDLANGDMCLVLGWSGDVFQAKNRADEAKNNVHLAYNIPKEGALMWFDNLAIPADAPHPQNALLFLNYMMRPEIIAKVTNYVQYANGNLASLKFVDEDIKNNPAIYPPESVIAKLYVNTPYDQKAQRALTRMWTKIKGGES